MKINTAERCVLVTGAAGFLGRYIAAEFKAQGWRVAGVDTASPENAPTESLDLYVATTLPARQFVDFLACAGPTLVVHCAGRASVPLSIAHPYDDFLTNTMVTVELLECLRLHRPGCGFLLLSSAAVYGNPDALPLTETTPANPVSPYGFHKRQAELSCLEYHQVYGLRTGILRLFSAYGPGLRRQVLWDLARKILQESTVALLGTGHESRDFIHGKDVAAATACVATRSALEGECINVGSGVETRIDDLALMVMTALGVTKPITFDGTSPPGMPVCWRADIRRLQSMGFQPRFDIVNGVANYVAWARPLLELHEG